jgi:hypothetical protein
LAQKQACGNVDVDVLEDVGSDERGKQPEPEVESMITQQQQ